MISPYLKMRYLFLFFLFIFPKEIISLQFCEAQLPSDCEQITSSQHFLRDKSPWIAIIGGCYTSQENYSQAETAAYLLAKQGYAIMTGSGLGIMEAANRGAVMAGGMSLGIILPEENLNDYIPETNCYQVAHICHRLHILLTGSSGCLAFPGGFGTLNEVCFAIDQFQYISPCPPIILIGEEFWRPLIHWMQNLYSYKRLHNIFLVNSSEEAVKVITEYFQEDSSH